MIEVKQEKLANEKQESLTDFCRRSKPMKSLARSQIGHYQLPAAPCASFHSLSPNNYTLTSVLIDELDLFLNFMKIQLSSVLLGCLVSFTDHEDFSSVLLCVV